MPQPVIKLTDFDQQPIIEYAITGNDLTNIYHYLQAMQAHLTIPGAMPALVIPRQWWWTVGAIYTLLTGRTIRSDWSPVQEW